MKKLTREKVILSKSTPHKSAERFLEMYRPNLISLESEWIDYKPTTGAYVRVTEATMISHVSRFLIDCFVMEKFPIEVQDIMTGNMVTEIELRPVPFAPKQKDIGEVVEALRQSTHRAIDEFQPPCWLDGGEGKPDPKDIIVCKNGLVNIRTRERMDHTPNFFTFTALPILFDEKAAPPKEWLKFLSEITAKRQPLIDLLQEFIGYLLSADNEQEVVLYMLGKSRGGKGTVQKIMQALLGSTNLASPSIKDFAGTFWAWGLMNKSVAIITDMTLSNKDAIKTAASHINMISGRDPVDVHRKFLAPLAAVMLLARIVLSGNALPDFGDHADALANRLLVVPFDVSFKGREDRGLARRMIANELAGILLWALDGLDRLHKNGVFSEPQESKDKKEELRRLANPVREFIDDCCEIETDKVVPRAELFGRYQRWCERVGLRPLADKDFAQRLYDIVPQGARYRPRGDDGRQVDHYIGLALRGAVEEFDFVREMESEIDLGRSYQEAFEHAMRERAERTVGDFTVH